MKKQLEITKRGGLIGIIVFWILITLLNYYYTNFFILIFIWFAMSMIFLFVTVYQIVKLIKERNQPKNSRILKVLVFAILLTLTFFRNIPNTLIEKADWNILKGKRIEIVQKIKRGELKANGKNDTGICELPFKFPIISTGGNEVWIIHGKENNSLTVRFWINRNFFDSPQTLFIYTNDQKTIERFERKIIEEPKTNWKLDKNWYRIHGYGY
ncbi:MAG: hypothetical protein ABGX00_15450 [Allomuricauda sp.]